MEFTLLMLMLALPLAGFTNTGNVISPFATAALKSSLSTKHFPVGICISQSF